MTLEAFRQAIRKHETPQGSCADAQMIKMNESGLVGKHFDSIAVFNSFMSAQTLFLGERLKKLEDRLVDGKQEDFSKLEAKDIPTLWISDLFRRGADKHAFSFVADEELVRTAFSAKYQETVEALNKLASAVQLFSGYQSELAAAALPKLKIDLNPPKQRSEKLDLSNLPECCQNAFGLQNVTGDFLSQTFGFNRNVLAAFEQIDERIALIYTLMSNARLSVALITRNIPSQVEDAAARLSLSEERLKITEEKLKRETEHKERFVKEQLELKERLKSAEAKLRDLESLKKEQESLKAMLALFMSQN